MAFTLSAPSIVPHSQSPPISTNGAHSSPQCLPAVKLRCRAAFAGVRAAACHLPQVRASAEPRGGPPTWDDLAVALPSIETTRVWDPIRDVAQCKADGHPTTRPGRAVLYRDRNGWCPYSERVWLGLAFKGIDFDEVLIDNQGSRPQFWYSLGGSTPVIRWPSGKTQGESLDILMALDEMFPDCKRRLLPDDPSARGEACRIANSIKAVLPRMCRPSSRAAFLYRGNGPLPRSEFEASLDKLEAMLSETPGPFFMGHTFSIADCSWVPFLERYAIQLPLLHDGLDPRDPARWPCLSKWYTALEMHVPAYASRVQGDALSWAAVLAVAGYGNAGSAADYKAPKGLSFDLGTSSAGLEIWKSYADGMEGVGATPAAEAARRLVANHSAVLADFQTQCGGLDAAEADLALRVCANCILLEGSEEQQSRASVLPPTSQAAVQAAASYLHSRICVPRDMGRLPADCYHSALTKLMA